MAMLILRTEQMLAMERDVPTLILPCDIWVRLSLRDYYHRPCVERRYVLTAANQAEPGWTDDEGLVVARLRRGTKSGTLALWAQGDDEEALEWNLEIATMAPALSKPGAVARLTSLDFLRDGQDVDAPYVLEQALFNFQAWVGLKMTGVLDDQTADALQLACLAPLSANPGQVGLPDNPGAEAMREALRRMLDLDAAPPPEDDEE